MSALLVMRPCAVVAGGCDTGVQAVPFQIAAKTCRAPSMNVTTRSAVVGLLAPAIIWMRVPIAAPVASTLKPSSAFQVR